MNGLLAQAEDSFNAGEHARAEALCKEVLERSPANPKALRLLGILRLQDGHAADAIAPLREALRDDPEDLSVLDALSAALMAAGDPAQAEDVVRRALALDASLVVARMRLGMALSSQGRWDEAASAFKEVIALDPQIADAHHNLGDALSKLHRPQDAIACFMRALAINPGNPDTHNALGFALQELDLWEAAMSRYERALALDAAHAHARYNLGVARLFRGEFGRGWAGYEQRLECRPIRSSLRQRMETLDLYESLPRWRGPGKTDVGAVAIWAEQGIGDQILYSTLIAELIASGVPLLYEVDRRLLPAYARAFPGVRFVALEDPPHRDLAAAGRVLLAGSVPGFYRSARKDFARQPARLLSALPGRVEHYRSRIARLGPGMKVALSWRSTREDWWVRKKNARLAELAPLLALPGVRFVDVQYGDTAAERAEAEAATGAALLHFDEVDYYNDLEELLAIVEACDLVITTSNATAHFAGALGKRTWLLYLADQPPFHYWAPGSDGRSPWYPSVEILSAAEITEWPALAGHAVARLEGRTVPDQPLVEARALTERAQSLRWEGRLAESRAAAERALELAPRLAGAWFNLAAVRVGENDVAGGIAAYRKALEIKPGYAEAWSNLGEALAAQGDQAGSLAAYRRAVAANPRLAPVWSNLGNALAAVGEVAEAQVMCRCAVEVDPAFAAGWNNLGNALHAGGRHEEAVHACETALRLAPGLAEAWGTLGAALHSLARYDEAIGAQRKALELKPGAAELHFNLGVTLQHCGRGAEAIECFRRALAIAPQHAQAHWELAFALLGAGQLPEGWEEYEWRWRRRNAQEKRYDFAAWNGDASRPGRLLLWAEQGVGDQILYAGMLPDLISSALSVTLEVDPRLAPLFRRSFPQLAVIPQQEPPAADSADFDCQAPLGSLARWLRPSFESFPRHRGYLKPEPSRVEGYRQRLLGKAAPGIRLIGISWKSANREFGAHKSSALLDWAGLLRAPHARYVDLQYGDTAQERAAVAEQGGASIEHLPDLDLYHDLDGVAALCAACDLVITVSNVNAHMAGALGRPVWLLAPRANGRLWYWFTEERTDSPWYPSMRICTQPRPGDWSGLLDAAAGELAAFLGGR